MLDAMNHEPNPLPSPQQMIQAGLDHIDQGITIFDQDLKLVGCNNRFLELLEFPEALAQVGTPFASFIQHNARRGEYGKGDVEQLVAERVDQARLFRPHKIERIRPDGRVILISGSPMQIGGFVTVYTDITEQKRREEIQERVIAERTKALALSEERLRLIANEVPAGIAHVDKDMNFRFVNRRFARAYGMTSETVIGRNCHDILSQDTMRFSAPFFEQARRGSPVDFEMRLTLPGGRVREIRTFLRPERHSTSDEIIGFYLLSIDVTQLNAANAAGLHSQKMDALGQLSSGIAHDFNNLLTIIIGNLVPLSEKLDDTELVTELAEPAIRAARRGAELTRRLLTVARRQSLQPTAVDVNEAITELAELLRPTLSEEVDLSDTLDRSRPLAFVDPGQLEMALLNLIMNARDSLSDGGRVRVSTALWQPRPHEAEALKLKLGNYVRLTIEDNGPGMSPEVQSRIFEPFFSTKADTGGGSGLGLSMVYGFVQQSNGAIQVNSTLGSGTRFTMFLPVAEDSPREKPVRQNSATFEVEPNKLALLVEDDADVRSVVRRQLIDLGYAIVEAGDGTEALNMLSVVENIDLLVTDLAMPGGVSGLQLARRVRSESPEIDVLLMTGHSRASESDDQGSDFRLLRKPFDAAELSAALTAEAEDDLGVRRLGSA